MMVIAVSRKAAWGRWADLRAVTVLRSLTGRVGSQDTPVGTLFLIQPDAAVTFGALAQNLALPFGCVMEAAIKPYHSALLSEQTAFLRDARAWGLRRLSTLC